MPDFMQIGDDLRIQPIGLGGAVAEADDIELGRGQQFQLGPCRDLLLETAGQRAASRHGRPQRLGAMDLEGEPGLEGTESAREIGAEIAGPGRAGGKPARLPAQIGGRCREARAVALPVAHQEIARVIGHLAPFVEIEGDGIRPLDAAEQRRQIRRHQGQRAIGRIDVEPDPLALGEIGNSGEIVHRTDIHRAGACRQ